MIVAQPELHSSIFPEGVTAQMCKTAALEAVGDRLRRARRAQRYTVEQLSIACGLARSEITSIEAGECTNIAWINRMSASLIKGLLAEDEALKTITIKR